MLKLVNPKGCPHGKYRMVVPSTGVPLEHFEYVSFVNLYLANLRANSIPIGVGWEEEMQDELCRQNPQWKGVCEDREARKDRRISNGDVRNFLSSVAKIIEKETKGSDAFVPKEEAERRAAICAVCPKNQPTVNWCSWCPGNVIWAIGKFRAAFKKDAPDLTSSQDDKIYSCEVCGCANAIQIHISTDCLTSVNNQHQYPDHCWKK